MKRLACLVAPLVVLATAAPAAASGELGLSVDGTTWTDSLARPLFDSQVSWAPGDVRTARFYVRNEAADAGVLSVDVEQVRRDALLDTGYLDVAARVDNGAWSSLAEDGSRALVDADDVASGAETAVDVRVTMALDAPNLTMVLATDLAFTVTLADADAAGGSDGTDATDGPDGPDQGTESGGLLPDTGSALAPWLPPLALLLLGGGLVLVARRRTSDDTDPHDHLQETS